MENITQKTKSDILRETWDYYIVQRNPRGFTNEAFPACCYLGINGNMCAVGRCMLPNKLQLKLTGNVGEISDGNGGLLPLSELLRHEYLGHDVIFWGCIQEWHDLNAYWYDHGKKLTKYGLNQFKHLWAKYGQGESDPSADNII